MALLWQLPWKMVMSLERCLYVKIENGHSPLGLRHLPAFQMAFWSFVEQTFGATAAMELKPLSNRIRLVDTSFGLRRSLGDCRPALPKGRKYQLVKTQTESHVRRPVVWTKACNESWVQQLPEIATWALTAGVLLSKVLFFSNKRIRLWLQLL